MADTVKVLAILQVVVGFFLSVICIAFFVGNYDLFYSIIGTPLGIWVSNVCFLFKTDRLK